MRHAGAQSIRAASACGDPIAVQAFRTREVLHREILSRLPFTPL
jgi:hypothetical protein